MGFMSSRHAELGQVSSSSLPRWIQGHCLRPPSFWVWGSVQRVQPCTQGQALSPYLQQELRNVNSFSQSTRCAGTAEQTTHNRAWLQIIPGGEHRFLSRLNCRFAPTPKSLLLPKKNIAKITSKEHGISEIRPWEYQVSTNCQNREQDFLIFQLSNRLMNFCFLYFRLF